MRVYSDSWDEAVWMSKQVRPFFFLILGLRIVFKILRSEEGKK